MNSANNPIGVFDSGVGGISVLSELYKLMPCEDYIYLGDSKNAPYGTKTEDEIKKYTKESVKRLTSLGVKAIVIACNTATSVAADELRQSYDIPIIGIEPAVKPAATRHKGQNVVVMATPMTLKKEKFISLMDSYSDVSKIIPLPCPNLVEIIEKGLTEGKEIDVYLENLFAPFKDTKISAIVLGCTHYPFIKNAIRQSLGYDVDIIDGGYGTAKETKRRLAESDLLSASQDRGTIDFISSMENENEINLMKKMFETAIDV